MSILRQDINNLINDLRRDTTDNSIDMDADGLRAVNSTLQLWDTEHDWPWQIEKMVINYNHGIYTYSIPSTNQFKALIDIRPVSPANERVEFKYLSNNKFDSDTINHYRVAIKNEAQKTYLRLKYDGDTATINNATSVDGNGTWVGATAISNLQKDGFSSFDLPASLSFDYSGTSGSLTNETMQVVDVTRYANQSTIYFNIYLQDVTNFTSITLRVGSSNSDYVTGVITTNYLGEPITEGWNKVKLVWDGTTTVVGTPDYTAFDYVSIVIAYGLSMTSRANRLENIVIAANVPVVMEYYSHFMVNEGATKKTVFTDAADATAEQALWSGEWEFATPQFANSVMELLFWMTGETQDRNVAVERIMGFLGTLKTKMPSKRRRHQVQMVADVNSQFGPVRNNRYR